MEIIRRQGIITLIKKRKETRLNKELALSITAKFRL